MIQQQKQRQHSQCITESAPRLTVGEIVIAVFNLLLGGAPLALMAYFWLNYVTNPPFYGSKPPTPGFSEYMLIGACLSAIFAGVGILVRARAMASLLLMILAVIALVIAIAGVITLDRSSGPGIYLPLAAMALFGLLQGLAALWLRRMQA